MTINFFFSFRVTPKAKIAHQSSSELSDEDIPVDGEMMQEGTTMEGEIRVRRLPYKSGIIGTNHKYLLSK